LRDLPAGLSLEQGFWILVESDLALARPDPGQGMADKTGKIYQAGKA
jgi:hypothetical protein